MNIDKQMKKFDKYYLFIHYKNKIKSIGYGNNKIEVIQNFKKKYLGKIKKDNYKDVTISLIKIESGSAFNLEMFLSPNISLSCAFVSAFIPKFSSNVLCLSLPILLLIVAHLFPISE